MSLISARHRRGMTRGTRPVVRDYIVVDAAEDAFSVWIRGREVTTVPPIVSVDSHGQVTDVGFDSDLALGGQTLRLGTRDRTQTRLVSAFVERNLAGLPPMVGARAPAFLVLDPDLARDERNPWRVGLERLGMNVLTVHRPLAAAAALGLDTGEATCHLMIEATDSTVAASVVKGGSIAAWRRIRRIDPEALRSFVQRCLTAVDPDEELEIRDSGFMLYGWAAAHGAEQIVDVVGLPLARTLAPGEAVAEGARIIAEEALPFLAAV